MLEVTPGVKVQRLTIVNRTALFALICFASVQASISADNTKPPASTLPEYLEAVEYKIKHQWFPPKVRQCRTAIVRFQLHQDGSVTDVALERSSMNKLVDQSAIRAVKNSSPVSGFPQRAPEILKLRFRFDYYDIDILAGREKRERKHLEVLSALEN